MTLNLAKTNEIILDGPVRDTYLSYQPCYPLADRIRSVKLARVFISDTLKCNDHLNVVLKQRYQRLCLLKRLRAQDLPLHQLHTVLVLQCNACIRLYDRFQNVACACCMLALLCNCFEMKMSCICRGRNKSLLTRLNRQHMNVLMSSAVLPKACSFHIRDLCHIRPCLDRPTQIAACIATSLVQSKLDYCNPVYLNLPASELNCLQVVQKALARTVCNISLRTHIIHVLNSLHFLTSLRERIEVM